MQRFGRTRCAFGAGLALAGIVAMYSCGSDTPAHAVAEPCSLNSDCSSPLVCEFQRCHNACKATRDCTIGQRCVTTAMAGVCQLPEEITCSPSQPCQTGQVCGSDLQCRMQCTPAGGCAPGEYCLPSGSFAACYSPVNASDELALIAAGILSSDGSVLIGPDSSLLSDGSVLPDVSTPADGGPQEGGGGSSDGSDGPGFNACPSAQTQFGNVAQGEANAGFQSGVGARLANELYIFNAFVGPDPANDAGAFPAIHVQAFDPQSGTRKGPALPLFIAPNLANPTHDQARGIATYGVAVAPTGEIAFLYGVNFYSEANGYNETQMYAAFLDSAIDSGASAAGLHLKKIVMVETALWQGQPQVVWSNTSKAFVMSWQYTQPGYFVKVTKFLADGRAAGGNTDIVPTDDPGGAVFSYNYPMGAVAESQSLFGVAYVGVSTHLPGLTVLDAVGGQVGSTISVAGGSPVWVTLGGTSHGYVYFYDNLSPASVAEVFVPTSSTGIVGGPTPDGGDAGAFPTFNFTGGVRAIAARAVSDDTGGIGGVGLALLYSNGVSFAYVNADGIGHQGPNQVIAHAYNNPVGYAVADFISLTNFKGSFVVSLYDATNHSTKVAASGCTQ
jgi:hypothetical protein